MLKGELYNSFDPQLIEMRKEARILTEKYNNFSIENVEERKAILKNC